MFGRLRERARAAWRDHGTKIIGAVGSGFGLLATATNWFGPKTLQGFMVAAGMCTIWRGFVNTNQAPR